MTKSYKNTVLFLLSFMLLFGSCQKDESALNDYDLFGRLQFGSGTWELIETQSFDNSIVNPEIVTSQPPLKTIYHYYMRSYLVGGVIVDVPTVKQYVDQSPGPMYDVEAELDRVVFRAGEIFGGTVYTVMENKPNTQVWSFTAGNETIIYTFKKCNCAIPLPSASESGG